jgi:hypothetical protein
MEIKGKEHVVIYLTDWQMRMVKDVLGLKVHVWSVPAGSPPVMRYMAPGSASVDPKSKRMYLTEWQRREIKDATGEDCGFIELAAGSVLKYKAPPRLAGRKAR